MVRKTLFCFPYRKRSSPQQIINDIIHGGKYSLNILFSNISTLINKQNRNPVSWNPRELLWNKYYILLWLYETKCWSQLLDASNSPIILLIVITKQKTKQKTTFHFIIIYRTNSHQYQQLPTVKQHAGRIVQFSSGWICTSIPHKGPLCASYGANVYQHFSELLPQKSWAVIACILCSIFH